MSVKAMSWVFDHSDVTHRGDLLVLLVLADHASDNGSGAYPSVETLARKARLTRRGAQLALRRLEAAGAIEPTGRADHGQVVYRVVMGAKSLRGEVTSRAKSPTPRGEVSDTEGRRGVRPNHPEPSENHPYPHLPPADRTVVTLPRADAPLGGPLSGLSLEQRRLYADLVAELGEELVRRELDEAPTGLSAYDLLGHLTAVRDDRRRPVPLHLQRLETMR